MSTKQNRIAAAVIAAGMALTLTACSQTDLSMFGQELSDLEQRTYALIDERVQTALEEYNSREAASADAGEDVQYVMYLGTNDKDTNEPVFTREEAKERAKSILIDHLGGYTIQEAEGGWVDEDGTQYQEFTLVIYMSDTTQEDVHAVADELIREFNQSSVLIQTNTTVTEFYSGE